jgi:hypothetical protein
VFGYDFMLTESGPPQGPGSTLPPVINPPPSCGSLSTPLQGVDVWLIEINSSPAIAEKLLPLFAKNLIRVAIDPLFINTDQETSDPTPSPPLHSESERSVGVAPPLYVEDFIMI